ncbi:MAG: glucosaminidase domain-containing protein, partial [Eubacteriaceae bacterium]|nr:glucosaminidase domain-containing protein [Eubacteriaceae bacterium]
MNMRKFVAISIILILLLLPRDMVFCNDNLTPIMGSGSLPADKMASFLYSGNDKKGLNPIDKDYALSFVEATIRLSNLEGVNYDIAFALMIHETGYLNFGGDVSPSQNNFGGLGATGGGSKGASFPDMETGILAVIQHLKCYGSDEPLVTELIDPRWQEKLRGKAVYAQWLGYADNPNGTGWANPGKGYGDRLIAVVEKVSGYEYVVLGEKDGDRKAAGGV